MGRHFYKTFNRKTVPCKLSKIAYRNESMKDAANNNKTSYVVYGNLFCLIEYNYQKIISICVMISCQSLKPLPYMYVKILPGCLKKKVYKSPIALELLTGNAFEEINLS